MRDKTILIQKTKTFLRHRIVPVLAIEMVLLGVMSHAVVTQANTNYEEMQSLRSSVTTVMKSSSKELVKASSAVEDYAVEQIDANELILLQTDTIEYADGFLGNPYRLGGRNIETGVDCAGFVNWVFSHGPAGISWNSWNVPGLYHEIGGSSVSVDDMKPGDIIFFGSGLSHVAIYAGGGQIVHAMDESHGICRTTLFRGDGKTTYSGKEIVDVRRVLK